MCVEAQEDFWEKLVKNSVTSADARARESRSQLAGDEFNY